MAKLSKEDVLKLAVLARLELTEQEVSEFQSEISSILEYVEKLKAVDLNDVEPTSQVTGLKNVMREDVTRQYCATPEELLKNVPATKDGYIKTKRILT